MGTNVDTRARRGPSAPRGEIADRILAHARESFAADGYAATTMQAVARAAGVDTRLIRYYYHDKDVLFEACLTLPDDLLDRIRTAVDVPLPERGQAVVRAMLSAWAHPDHARVLRTCLLIAAHEPAAMARVRAVFSDGLIPALAAGLDAEEVPTRGGLISSQMLGLSFSRFIFTLEAAAIPDDQVIAMVGAGVQHYLTDPLAQA